MNHFSWKIRQRATRSPKPVTGKSKLPLKGKNFETVEAAARDALGGEASDAEVSHLANKIRRNVEGV